MFKIVLLLAAIAGSLAMHNYNRCNTGETPEELEVNLCEEAPCTFYKGDQLVVHSVSTAPYDSENITFNMDILLQGTRTPYPLPSEVADGCAHLDPECPVWTGTRIEYTFDMMFDEVSAAGVPVTMEIQVKDDDEKNMFCISFPATVFNTARP